MLNFMPFSPSNLGRYAPPIEYLIDEFNETNEAKQGKQDSKTSNIPPPLMSLSISPPMPIKNIQTKSTVPTSVIKENIEPLSFPQHGPGPIQRPNKLHYPPAAQSSSSFLIDPIQSPSTPEILVQINDLLHHQNSITTVLSTPNAHTPTNTSPAINVIPTTSNVSWTPFSPTNWSSKCDSSWSMATIPTTSVSLTTQIQNPFAQRQTSNEVSLVWSPALEMITPTLASSNAYLQQDPEWNELLSSSVSSSIQTTKPTNNSWPEFLPESDSPPIDNVTSNKQENEANNPFWNLINFNEGQQNSSALLWPKTLSAANDHDQSRWDFAR